jgi:[protein-PII] uridylyltransferase
MSKEALTILKDRKQALVAYFLKTGDPDFLMQHAHLIDQYFCESFERSDVGPRMGLSRNPYAVIALGGFGRKEQCIYSDVDLLLLFDKRINDGTEKLVQEMIYPLWDIGFEVGYATRSLNDCLQLAQEDIEVLTAMLDSRFICGMSNLYADLMERLREKILLKHPHKIMKTLVERNRKRHEHFGDSTYLLEPNLKEGQGGLRDYHTMLWVARVKSSLIHPRDLEYSGYLSCEEYESMHQALEFIWKVRNYLHHLAGRKCDQLFFEYQIKLANILDFKRENGQEPVEVFMGKLHGRMECIKQIYLMFLRELGFGKNRKSRRALFRKKTQEAGLEVKRDMLGFSSGMDVFQFPELLIRIFEESARLKIPLNAEAKRIIKTFLHLIDDEFRARESAIRTFERILLNVTDEFSVLNEMLISGFLVRWIPEMSAVVNRIQYDEYHIYPVDKHSLRTVEILKSFSTVKGRQLDPLAGELYREIKHRKILLWAALLHDIGKGVPQSDHSKRGADLVTTVLQRFGYKPAVIETVAFLVRHHLTLIKIATRRDINSEETAIFCARQIKDVQRLKMLYLLTVADSMATGPKAWNSWTAVLLRDLFLKVVNILENGELVSEEAVAIVQDKKNRILANLQSEAEVMAVQSLMNAMSPRYLLYTSIEDMQEHIALYQRLNSHSFVWDIRKTSDAAARTVTICAPDCPGLFSKIAGVFTMNQLDILDAQVYTWKNNTALDIFTVTPPPDQIFEEERWQRVEKNMQEALAGRLDMADLIRREKERSSLERRGITEQKPHIVVDNQSSSFYTIVEVFSYDFPGLLYRITDTIFKANLNIWVAKIATHVDQVVDVFYVRDDEERKIEEPAQIAELKNAIEAVLPSMRSRKVA